MIRSKFSEVALKAETHPPGYSFHKYWARKPHNVVRRVLQECGVGADSVVIDPFCGSGVPLSEAATLGATCVGIDVNPVAVELTRTTLAPPDPARYLSALHDILEDVVRDFGPRYLVDGCPIRYAVHATVVRCASCGSRIAADAALRRGRKYVCPNCEARLRFNLENAIATRQLSVIRVDGAEVRIQEEQVLSKDSDDGSSFDHQFTHNARILAFRGMRTRHLFTVRNFAVLTSLAEHIAKLPDEVRPAASLTLTASVAQCSRLIAYRNKLTTGGPAWTVPGFWVPPVHLETNPLVHIRARVQRIYKGLKHLRQLSGRNRRHRVHEGDSGTVLEKFASQGLRPAVAFLDPPYGDSIPYVEFSAMWNSFLGALPDPGLDIAVSNRSRGDGNWEKYEQDLHHIIAKLRRALVDDCRVIVTFNNKDLRAWKALLGALQAAELRCRGAFYQHPAVVSAKAQLARSNSYIGDVYCVFEPCNEPPSRDTAPVLTSMRRALRERNDSTNREALQRAGLVEFLRSNVDASVVDKIPILVNSAFNGNEGGRDDAATRS